MKRIDKDNTGSNSRLHSPLQEEESSNVGFNANFPENERDNSASTQHDAINNILGRSLVFNVEALHEPPAGETCCFLCTESRSNPVFRLCDFNKDYAVAFSKALHRETDKADDTFHENVNEAGSYTGNVGNK